MNLTQIVEQLRAERNRLDAAIEALEGVGSGTSAPKRRRGRPPGSRNQAATNRTPGRRPMSAAARKRIAEAMRKRWAARKAGEK
jgi:hypothetical protein